MWMLGNKPKWHWNIHNIEQFHSLSWLIPEQLCGCLHQWCKSTNGSKCCSTGQRSDTTMSWKSLYFLLPCACSQIIARFAYLWWNRKNDHLFFIKSFLLSPHLFNILCNKMGSRHKAQLLQIKVQWLSGGKALLQRSCELTSAFSIKRRVYIWQTRYWKWGCHFKENNCSICCQWSYLSFQKEIRILGNLYQPPWACPLANGDRIYIPWNSPF